jgi:flagellar biogenesis protein FliO
MKRKVQSRVQWTSKWQRLWDFAGPGIMLAFIIAGGFLIRRIREELKHESN